MEGRRFVSATLPAPATGPIRATPSSLGEGEPDRATPRRSPAAPRGAVEFDGRSAREPGSHAREAQRNGVADESQLVARGWEAALAASESIDLPQPDAWQVVEALRLGVVPSRGVHAYAVARSRELADLERLFAARRGCRVLWGDYGTGKSHLLDVAEQLALDRGFVTARLTLDPRHNALSHPLRLYRAIMTAMRTRRHIETGFASILDPLAASLEHRSPLGDRASRFFSPYLHALQHGDDACIALLGDYVRGERVDGDALERMLKRCGWRGPRPLLLSGYRTYGRMYMHLVGTLASWCEDAGFSGLALLFDEIERVDALRADDQRYAFEVLRHYAAVLMRPETLCFDPESLHRGGHDIHRQLDLRFRDDQPLTALFALTPLPRIQDEFLTITTSHEYDLRLMPLRTVDVVELVSNITRVYRLAFPTFEPSPTALTRIAESASRGLDRASDSIRAAVRAVVFELDHDRTSVRPDD
ncbi:MAG: BREX system ATP-binding domain-containing protein [Planctomycetota bacterium]